MPHRRPIFAGTGGESAPASPSAGRSRRAVVLVVDDVEGNRELICRRLEPFGYDLHQAETGEAALDFIRARKPDLVLLDYMMPNMNGIEVLRVMREDWQVASTPVIMVTARAESAAVVAALDAGADDYVTKPIDFDILRARVETQLTKQRSSESLRQVNAALDERATMRVLAFDELRDELEREIIQRRQAEKALAEARVTLGRCDVCGLADMGDPALHAHAADHDARASADSAQAAGIARAVEIVDALARAVAAGRPVNPAMLSGLRMQLGKIQPGR